MPKPRMIVATEGARQLRIALGRVLLPDRYKAEMLGVTPSLLSLYLSGRRRPPLDKLFWLEDEFGIPARLWATRINPSALRD
jgi:transcriptional regulator with XRE-family HTH domain